jgi:hypothetical protein
VDSQPDQRTECRIYVYVYLFPSCTFCKESIQFEIPKNKKISGTKEIKEHTEFNKVIRVPMLNYVCGNLTMNQLHKRKIVLRELQFLRSDASFAALDFIRNAELRRQLNVRDLHEKISYERIGTNTF